jgi:hypothetical protein
MLEETFTARLPASIVADSRLSNAQAPCCDDDRADFLHHSGRGERPIALQMPLGTSNMSIE